MNIKKKTIGFAGAMTGMMAVFFAHVQIAAADLTYKATFLPPQLKFGEGKGAGNPADIITSIYNYSLGIVGAVALGTIIYAAILRVTSGGSSGQITKSNDYIQSAIWGIVLLFGTAVIFNTINPEIVNVKGISANLVLPEQYKIPETKLSDYIVEKEAASTTAITAATTRQGAINLYGGTHPELAAKIQPCNDCVTTLVAAKFAVKNTACFGAGCQINRGLVDALNNLQTIANASNLQWRMTEGYPPTVMHQSSCHFDGTCVDIALTGGASASAVNAFINAAQTAGLTVINEYSVGNNPQRFETTTGGHLHVHQ